MGMARQEIWMAAAFGYFSQIARSLAVIVSHPNVNMYRPGAATRPTCAQVILLTTNSLPPQLQPAPEPTLRDTA
jgi:hypothetical protein